LDLAGPDDHLARGGAAGFLGFAAWAAGDVSTALETFARAVASLHAAGSLVDGLSATVVLSDLWLAAGRPGRARRLCTQALASAEAHGAPVGRAIAELHVALSEMDVEVGDLESAEHHLVAAAAYAGLPMNESRYRWFVAKGLLARAGGDADGAVQFLNQAEQLHRPGFFPEVRPIAALKARIWIEQGRLSEAADWARERGLSVTGEARYLSEFDHLTLVRLLLAQHRVSPDSGVVAQAARLLDRLSEAAQASGRAGSVLEIRLQQALVRHAQGRRPQALESLAQAFADAPEPHGYARVYLDAGPPLLSLLRDAERTGAGGELRRVLRRATPEDSGPSTASSPIESLSERELDVLRLLDTALTGPEIARELFVSHNTVRTHTKHIFTKLGVTNRRAAVLRARERGLI
jgi:LuxR family maltose regulon positive regulatory protein